jgi:hypothetical protein
MIILRKFINLLTAIGRKIAPKIVYTINYILYEILGYLIFGSLALLLTYLGIPIWWQFFVILISGFILIAYLIFKQSDNRK